MIKPAQLSTHQKMDLVILFVLACLVISYLNNAYQASTDIRNLILILPVAALVLVLCTIQFIKQLVAADAEPEKLEPVSSVLPVISLFAGYVITLPWLGFDVGTFAFIAAFLWLHGERRLQWTIGYALAFASVVAWFFSLMLPYPMPMLLIPTDY